MGQLPFWHSVELSAGERPVLREKEVDVHVEDNVGLYQGKSKIINRQDGRVYLTSQRLIYIDNVNTAKYSCSIELADVKSIEYSPRFLRSSPKISIIFKSFKNKKHIKKLTSSNSNLKINWECQICSSSTNEISINYKPNLSRGQDPVYCNTCGIKPDDDMLMNIIKSYKDRSKANKKDDSTTNNSGKKEISCSVCTFLNHPSLRNCEICGSNLPITDSNMRSYEDQEILDDRVLIQTDSPDRLDEVKFPFIKLSFHKNGDEIFYAKFLETLERFEWERLISNGDVNKHVVQINDQDITNNSSSSNENLSSLGIHGLAKQDDLQTRRNEQVINSSLDDLETLLEKANEILGMIDSFKRLDKNNSSSSSSEKTIYKITQDVLKNSTKETLYIEEISRKISEFLINEKTLEEEGNVITLIDLFALYNRGRIGEGLISPDELFKACSLFNDLKLPLTLKKINNVFIVQDLKFNNNEEIISRLKRFIMDNGEVDDSNYKYSNILNISDYFNWSLTISEEFLQIAIDSGELIIDQQIFGTHYYLNIFNDFSDDTPQPSNLVINNESTQKLSSESCRKSQSDINVNDICENQSSPYQKRYSIEFPKIPQSSFFEASNITDAIQQESIRSEEPQTFSVPTPAPSNSTNISKTLLDLQGLEI